MSGVKTVLSLKGFARQQLNWERFATATVNDSQTVDTTGLPVSLHPCCHVCDTVLFYCSTVLSPQHWNICQLHALDIDDHCSRAFQSCHAMHSTSENYCATSKKESVELLCYPLEPTSVKK